MHMIVIFHSHVVHLLIVLIPIKGHYWGWSEEFMDPGYCLLTHLFWHIKYMPPFVEDIKLAATEALSDGKTKTKPNTIYLNDFERFSSKTGPRTTPTLKQRDSLSMYF